MGVSPWDNMWCTFLTYYDLALWPIYGWRGNTSTWWISLTFLILFISTLTIKCASIQSLDSILFISYIPGSATDNRVLVDIIWTNKPKLSKIRKTISLTSTSICLIKIINHYIFQQKPCCVENIKKWWWVTRICWLIGKCFTPSQQYFSHITRSNLDVWLDIFKYDTSLKFIWNGF